MSAARRTNVGYFFIEEELPFEVLFESLKLYRKLKWMASILANVYGYKI